MKEKKFWLPKEAIRPNLAPGRGWCIASDSITVDGNRVGFMYREESDNGTDSGWRFFTGAESQEYADDPKNFAIYDVNTIANYDPDIIPFLDSPASSAFARNNNSGQFEPVDFPDVAD